MTATVATAHTRRPTLVLAIVPIWIVLAIAGWWLLARYAGTAGELPAAPAHWPSDTQISRNINGKTLVLFAHPHCPCTRATMSELERIVAQSGGEVQPRVVFFKPREAEAGWEHTDLWDRAAGIPGVVVTSDLDGAEAERFGATTSGHTLLYDAAGNLLFSGGITAARGHEGDNPGQGAVVSLLNQGSAECRGTPVFGCPIVNVHSSQGKKP